ncbi:Transposase [Actinacidiphila glaucinigra]|uniref:Transposase n=1 Tax=Actinacidiphila glaucinigra TaxID=235986 RepID=A0A239LVT7_9ACTN|nr:Transposase [Actinacidiphila glaucinigra]
MPGVFCGIDWASDHHDVALIDQDGTLLAKLRIDDNAAGLTHLLDLLADHGDTPQSPVPVAIETSHGLLVSCLRATGRPVYAINPLTAARYRDRYALTRKKSDHLDAKVLANILRTDINEHRPLPTDSELAQAIAVLARAQQDAVWDRTQAGNKLRSHLREYFPGFLTVFVHFREGITSPVTRTLLAAAPTPIEAARLSRSQLRALLVKAGRQREITPEVERLHQLLREPQMQQPPLVEQAMGAKTQALLRQFNAACTSANELEAATVAAFETHPDAEIITSFPASEPSPAPASWQNSATTTPDSPTPGHSRPTPAPPPSPAPQARKQWCWPGTSRTNDWPPSATCGPSPPSPHHPAPEPTTTAAEPPKNATPPPNATSSTACSAASTTA